MKIRTIRFTATVLNSLILTLCLLLSGCGAKAASPEGEKAVTEAAADAVTGEEGGASGSGKGGSEAQARADHGAGSGQAASEDETIRHADVVEEGMAPVYADELKDGIYSVEVDSSSSMFKITSCALTVKDGKMSAVMTMSGTGYLKLYMGTGEEAAKASEQDYIPFVENEKGEHTYEVLVEALDKGINCSAFSKNKEKWYDRVLVFRADSLPLDAFAEGKGKSAESLKLEDGLYTVEVTLGGGSGRAFVQSPAALRMEGGKAFATIIWGSANYDYMKVGGQKIEWDGAGDHSTFEIPVATFDWKLTVDADTIAMSEPHEIRYTLFFDAATIQKAE